MKIKNKAISKIKSMNSYFNMSIAAIFYTSIIYYAHKSTIESLEELELMITITITGTLIIYLLIFINKNNKQNNQTT